MRKVSGVLLILALMGAFLLPGLARSNAANLVALNGTQWLEGSWPQSTGTPRAALPFILRNPTLTPTKTPTPTLTPTVTRTPTQAPATATRTGIACSNGFTGRLVFVEPKTNYYTNIEWIKFWQQIYNPTGCPKSYTFLGVNVHRETVFPQYLGFHTSLTGAPDWISAGCWGPFGNTDWNTGHRCGMTQNDGWHEDHIGASSNIPITIPARYRIEYWVCYSSHSACENGPGDWRQLGTPLIFQADQNPAQAQDLPTPVPDDDYPLCFLIQDDPNNIYLKCDE